MNKEKKTNISAYILPLLILALLAVGGWFVFRDTQPPKLSITPELTDIGKGAKITFTAADPGSGLKWVTAKAIQGDKSIPLFEKQLAQGTMSFSETVTFDKDRVKEGNFTVSVEAKDASFYPFGAAGKATASRDYTLDTTPPRVYVKTHTTNLNQGGAGLVEFALSEPAVEAGIRVGDRFFPAYRQDNAQEINYLCMFAMPWDTSPSDFAPVITARDKAGNTAMRSFNYHVNARNFRRDRIGLSDSFMERVLPQFTQFLEGTEGSTLDQYVHVNNDLRKQNAVTIRKVGRDTASVPLWEGTFERLPNAANRARFADYRDYLYKGKVVDNQTHLGLDLASLRHAPIPAANTGKVVHASPLGIYGNCVIIDHGLGLQSLYSHMSQIDVQVGQDVARGDIIGKTGSTGLAGGDHLHFGVYISGTPVQPLEWFDGHWIKNNIDTKLGR